MKNKITTLILALIAAATCFAQTTSIRFHVTFNGDNIGTLTAEKTVKGRSEQIDIRTVTDAKVLVMAVHVESELSLTKDNAVLKKAIVYRHSNRGSENISGYTQKQNGFYVTNINHKRDTIQRPKITICLTDLYFQEPIAVKEVYSNMYGTFIAVSEVSAHRYRIVMPDGKVNFFTYRNGALHNMELELPIGKVTSTRITD